MQRSSYSDKHTVTVVQGEKHVVFDFTSRVKNKSVLQVCFVQYVFDSYRFYFR